MRKVRKYSNDGGSILYETVLVLNSTQAHTHTHTTGWVLLDRSGKYFGLILNFLRDGSVSLPETKTECIELLTEAK